MVRVSVLLCLLLLVTVGVMINVSFADDNEVRSTDLKKVKGKQTDQSISKVNDDDHDDEHDDDHDDDHDHDNDDDHDHDRDNNDDHDNDDDHDHDHDNDNDDDDHDHDSDSDDDENDDHDHDNEGDDDNDGGDEEDDEKETLGVYELKKGSLTVKFTNRGASIISLLFPDKNGKVEDVVLGYDSVNEYMNDTVFFGATVGRVANRREKIVTSDAKIHGKYFGDVNWRVTKHSYIGKRPYIVFTYTSPDGEQGFPGKLDVTATYKLVGENKLKLVMEAKAREKATPVNLVHHSYWNLGGHNNGDILSEEIQILGSGYAHVDDNRIPTGKILAVKGTPYDFLKLRPIKDNINEIEIGHGINYCLDGVANQMRKVVVLVDKKSKRKMELSTDQSGLKFYTGGSLKTIKGKNGSVYRAYSGLCLETQSFPNAINYLPSLIVEPGKKYKHTMLFKFSIVP